MDTEVLKSSMPNLHSAAVSENELFKGVIDFTRSLEEYPTINTIAEHISAGEAPVHIYTKDLNVHGHLVKDDMAKYLENEGISSSMLKAALKTPLDFRFALSDDKEQLEKLKDTSHFNMGTYLHQCLLEPTKFSRAVVEPKYSRASYEGINVGIEFYKDQCKKQGINYPADVTDTLQSKKTYLDLLIDAAGVEPVSEENFIKIQILKRNAENYAGGIIFRLLKYAKREISVYYTDPETGMRLKVRPDALQFSENIGCNAVVSIKSTACPTIEAFYSHAANLHYDLSEGMYQQVVSAATGRDFNATLMIVLQTVAPYHVAVLLWKPEDIEMGKHKYHHALQNAHEIINSESVKGLDVYAEDGHFGIISMQLPGWNQREILPQNI